MPRHPRLPARLCRWCRRRQCHRRSCESMPGHPRPSVHRRRRWQYWKRRHQSPRRTRCPAMCWCSPRCINHKPPARHPQGAAQPVLGVPAGAQAFRKVGPAACSRCSRGPGPGVLAANLVLAAGDYNGDCGTRSNVERAQGYILRVPAICAAGRGTARSIGRSRPAAASRCAEGRQEAVAELDQLPAATENGASSTAACAAPCNTMVVTTTPRIQLDLSK